MPISSILRIPRHHRCFSYAVGFLIVHPRIDDHFTWSVVTKNGDIAEKTFWPRNQCLCHRQRIAPAGTRLDRVLRNVSKKPGLQWQPALDAFFFSSQPIFSSCALQLPDQRQLDQEIADCAKIVQPLTTKATTAIAHSSSATEALNIPLPHDRPMTGCAHQNLNQSPEALRMVAIRVPKV